jgi:RNA polymerase sigma-70 factor (ECF subfamily)
MDEINQGSVLKAALRYQDAMLTVAYGLLRDWTLAEDAVQESFVLVTKRWTDFQPGTSLFAWVRAIVRLKALEVRRARPRERALEDDRLEGIVDRAIESHMDEDSALRQQGLMGHLRRCLDELGRVPARLLHGFYIEGRSYEQVAGHHAMTLEAVLKMLYRMRKQLRDCAERRLAQGATS